MTRSIINSVQKCIFKSIDEVVENSYHWPTDYRDSAGILKTFITNVLSSFILLITETSINIFKNLLVSQNMLLKRAIFVHFGDITVIDRCKVLTCKILIMDYLICFSIVWEVS